MVVKRSDTILSPPCSPFKLFEVQAPLTKHGYKILKIKGLLKTSREGERAGTNSFIISLAGKIAGGQFGKQGTFLESQVFIIFVVKAPMGEVSKT